MKSKSGYSIYALKKRNESLCQKNDKLKDEIERLNMELSEAVKLNESMVHNINQNQKAKVNMYKQIQELTNSFETVSEESTDRLDKHIKYVGSTTAHIVQLESELKTYKDNHQSLLRYVRNVSITIIIFGVIILFTQYM